MNRCHHNQGVALITVLLIVALATIIAVSMARQQFYDTRRTASLLDGDQAWQYAEGGEIWAKSILKEDLKESKIDSLDEAWAYTLPPIPLPGGGIQGQLSDLQGRFNINNLIIDGKLDAASMTRFQGLLKHLDLDPGLAQAVIDWIDQDIDAQPPDGAEDDHYMGLELPYLTANRLMSDISELRLIKGFDQETYLKLTPYLCTLPVRTSINVNTAAAELITSLSPEIDQQKADALIEAREVEPFENLDEFLQHPELKGITIDSQELDVRSDYFLLYSEIQIGSTSVSLNSVLHRQQNGMIITLQRHQAQ